MHETQNKKVIQDFGFSDLRAAVGAREPVMYEDSDFFLTKRVTRSMPAIVPMLAVL